MQQSAAVQDGAPAEAVVHASRAVGVLGSLLEDSQPWLTLRSPGMLQKGQAPVPREFDSWIWGQEQDVFSIPR